jgi:hypothetical protein
MFMRHENLFWLTVPGNPFVEAAGRIVELLVGKGHEVFTLLLVRDDAWESDRRLTPREVYLRDVQDPGVLIHDWTRTGQVTHFNLTIERCHNAKFCPD